MVFLEKYVNGEFNVKVWLIAKKFEEGNSNILSASSTCSKESMPLILNIITSSSKWLCWCIDTKSMFLINKNIERVVYVKPPKEVYCEGTTL